MKTLNEYSKLLRENIESPLELRKIELELAADYAYYTAILIPLKEQKSMEWINLKYSGSDDKLLSDKLVEMKWRITECGQREHAVSLKLKALEKMISSIKDAMYISSQAIRNEV